MFYICSIALRYMKSPDPVQALANLFFLPAHLLLITAVLQLAAAALPCNGTLRLCAVRGRL